MRKRGDDNTYYIGSNIRTARMRADLTQEKMSEMIGVTPQYLSDLERGLVGTSVSTLIRICTELNVSADFILFGRGDEKDGANSTLIEKIQRLPKYKADMVESTVDILLEAMDMEPGKRAGNDR
jgi:transcriptional regulator with XRE-family HTH domain